MARGRFITLEGGEGAGKSTQARHLATWLARDGIEVVRTREPGGTPGGEAIRAVLLEGGPFDVTTEALLHFAARREHIARVIQPALARGAWVVSDRFADSTRAYQVHGQGFPAAGFASLVALTLDGLTPDLTLVLDLAVGIGAARSASRGGLNRYERLDAGFHARVRAGFHAIAAAEPERCVLIDASEPEPLVSSAIQAVVRQRLGGPA